jgi:mannose-6-phosphate isomerase
MENNIFEKPWGTYEILVDENYYKTKRITIKPGEEISYQYHYKRQECWVIVSGIGLLTLDDKDLKVKYGDVINISKLQKHMIKNIGEEELVFIEVQTGDYFGEDDIVRIRDKYNR